MGVPEAFAEHVGPFDLLAIAYQADLTPCSRSSWREASSKAYPQTGVPGRITWSLTT